MPRHSVGPWFRNAKNAWYVWHEGKLVSLGIKGEENESDAVKAWHRLMGGAPLAQPTNAKPEPQKQSKRQEPSDAKLTIPVLVKAFLADAQQRIKPESYRGYAKFLNPFADAFASTPPASLTASAVERFSKKAEWSQSYRCGFVGTVVSLLRWAVDAGKLERSPIQGIRKPKKQSRGRKAVISQEDHAKLVKAAQGEWKDFLSLLWLTGARPGEIAGLTAADIDLASKTAILSEHKTAEQTGKDRLIVLADEAVAILRRLIAERPQGLLFPGEKGQRMNANNGTCLAPLARTRRRVHSNRDRGPVVVSR